MVSMLLTLALAITSLLQQCNTTLLSLHQDWIRGDIFLGTVFYIIFRYLHHVSFAFNLMILKLHEWNNPNSFHEMYFLSTRVDFDIGYHMPGFFTSIMPSRCQILGTLSHQSPFFKVNIFLPPKLISKRPELVSSRQGQ